MDGVSQRLTSIQPSDLQSLYLIDSTPKTFSFYTEKGKKLAELKASK
jgi:hypothetical protein